MQEQPDSGLSKPLCQGWYAQEREAACPRSSRETIVLLWGSAYIAAGKVMMLLGSPHAIADTSYSSSAPFVALRTGKGILNLIFFGKKAQQDWESVVDAL